MTRELFTKVKKKLDAGQWFAGEPPASEVGQLHELLDSGDPAADVYESSEMKVGFYRGRVALLVGLYAVWDLDRTMRVARSMLLEMNRSGAHMGSVKAWRRAPEPKLPG